MIFFSLLILTISNERGFRKHMNEQNDFDLPIKTKTSPKSLNYPSEWNDDECLSNNQVTCHN